MTPSELRVKAARMIDDARLLLENSPTNSAYLAGYAVEFMLKARLLVKRNWPRLPTGGPELNEWCARDGIDPARLFIHDLDKLMAQSEYLKLNRASFSHIDWQQVCTWSDKVRYRPEGSYTNDTAASLIDEVERVVFELALYEVLDRLLCIEIEVAERYGPFHFFGLVSHQSEDRLVLLVSYAAPNPQIWQRRFDELRDCVGALDADMRKDVTQVMQIKPDDGAMQAMFTFGAQVGPIVHSPRSCMVNNFVVGLPLPPSGYVITLVNWATASLIPAWGECREKHPEVWT